MQPHKRWVEGGDWSVGYTLTQTARYTVRLHHLEHTAHIQLMVHQDPQVLSAELPQPSLLVCPRGRTRCVCPHWRPEVLVSLFLRLIKVFAYLWKKILEVLVTSSVCLHEKRSKSLLRFLYIHAGSQVSCCFTSTLYILYNTNKGQGKPKSQLTSTRVFIDCNDLENTPVMSGQQQESGCQH